MNNFAKLVSSFSALIASLALLWIAYGYNRPDHYLHLTVGGRFQAPSIDVTLDNPLGGFQITH